MNENFTWIVKNTIGFFFQNKGILVQLDELDKLDESYA